MGIICGWLGEGKDSKTTDPRKMVASATGYSDSPIKSCVLKSAALGGRSISIFDSGTLCAVLEGNPAWKDDKLASLANESGNAQALCKGFSRHGKHVLDYLAGSFSLAVLDPSRKTAMLPITASSSGY